ncbi:uncharacterized protein PHACADRAFT_197358 [Phanerochaete carnosa HHB-10118-sp]|uniref:Uncharacterized protein n=1 Tax=Phanerochaete carnosa (strain HHB-10118-sp) TaxID=650164 RepID=K5WRC3_PHACS|nr:uncharacterized protein PHACADRAFT_197358 [Phanerochaete carnosa HHB-10118-sp]EKM52922.1 hypothetical protein PHACADRAFT_197358 [Phanerochaete carnosa HHB-10118-sp]
MGISSVVASSVFSSISYIMRCYEELIVNARREVCLTTDHWEPSCDNHRTHDAIIEL